MPAREYHFYVYILASRSHQLYIGITNNLVCRIAEHREGRHSTYTARYNINRLVHFIHFHYVNNAIACEKRLKSWTRAKKLTLINQNNPTWQDLSKTW